MRTTAACKRCHKQKTKCTGERPSCRSCTGRKIPCVYEVKNRRVNISLADLEALRERLRKLESTQNIESSFSDSPLDKVLIYSTSNREFLIEIAKSVSPDLPIALEPEDFSLPEIDNNDDDCMPTGVVVIDNLRTFLGFLQFDYHFFLYDELLLNIDSIYTNGVDKNDPLILMQFCMVMSLGAAYDKNGTTSNEFPGYLYLKLAQKYLHELDSSFSLIAVQTHILLTWYLLFLNNKGLASVHSAAAVRKALFIGIHKKPDSTISPVEKEHRSRTWWTVFVTEILCNSILGIPQTISLNQVDAPLPSKSQLGIEEKGLFFDHTYFTLNIKLAIISSEVLSSIYNSSFKVDQTMPKVIQILEKLERFKDELPGDVKKSFESFCSKERRDASLFLFYNQTILLVLRPVFLYYFNLAYSDPINNDRSIWLSHPFQTGIKAAESIIEILKFCKDNGMISKVGFFDSNYLYSAILIKLVFQLMEDRLQNFFDVLLPLSILHYQSASGNRGAQAIESELNALFYVLSKKQ